MQGENQIKVLLYQGGRELVKTSGIGKAMEHQEKALESAGIPFTKNPEEEHTIVQLNTIFPDSYRMAKKARRKGKKVVYYAHSTMEDFKNSFIGSNTLAPIFKKWLEICYKQGDVILTPTPYSKQIIERMQLKRPVFSLSNGIDLDYFTRSKGNADLFKKSLGLPETSQIVLSIGHYIERKGILDFVELARRLPQYDFVWLGHTNLKVVPESVRKAVRTPLSNLHFPGYLSQEGLRDGLKAAKLFFFPTFEETEGIVLLEAMAMQVPVLVRNIPIYRQIIERQEVHAASELNEFEEKIKQIMENRADDLTQKGYQTVTQKSIPVVGKKLFKIYDGTMEPEEQYK